MSERILETHNIFIDTSSANKESGSRGDDFQLHLNTQSVDASRNQFIRLTLNDFSMYKTFTDVNDNNRVFTTKTTNGTPATRTFKAALPKKNYDTIFEIASAFSNIIGKEILTSTSGAATAVIISDLTPDATTSINGTTDNIIRFSITTQNGGIDVAHGLTRFLIQFEEEEGDIFALLGGNRLYEDSEVLSSILVDLTSANVIHFKCLYPAQRSTTSHIYLRTSLTTGASETASLGQEKNIELAQEVSYSNILAKIPVNTEFCTFSSNTGKEYYVDLHQKHLNNIKLYLTDQHNRRIGRRPASSGLKTASGVDNTNAIEQSTLGNLNFNCVIRVDIVNGGPINEVHFPIDQPQIPIRKSGILVQTNRAL